MVETKDWRKLVELDPLDIKFIKDENDEPFCKLDLKNESAEHILFKVKTTVPSNYVVKPN